MNIFAKCSAAFKDESGKEYIIQNKYIGSIPKFVENSPYFQKLIDDGSIIMADQAKSEAKETKKNK